MNNTLSFILAAVLALALPSLVAAGQSGATVGVTLPLEYYWGRWTPGLTVGASAEVMEDCAPAWTGVTSFNRGPIQIRFEGATLETGYTEPPFSVNGGSMNFAYRPRAPMQFRIAARHFKNDRRVATSADSYHEHERDESSLGFGVDWSRRQSITIPTENVAYSYMAAPMPSGGEALLSIDLQVSDDDYSEHQYDLPAHFPVRQLTESTVDYSADIMVLFSPLDRLSLTSRFLASTTDLSDVRRRLDPDRPEQKYEHQTDSHLLTYDLEATLRASRSLFVSVGANQQFSASSRRWEQFDSGERITYDDRDPLRVRESVVGAALDLVTKGDFQSAIILDDYRNYYRNMLFAHQWHFRFGVDASLPAGTHARRYNSVILGGRLTYGLSSHINIGGRAEYRWNDYPDSPGLIFVHHWEANPPELITSSVLLNLRSFTYNPGRGPGWDRDTPIDIAFGPLPRSGDAWLEIAYRPSYLRKPYDADIDQAPGFLAFDGLKGYEGNLVELAGEVGTGMRTSLGITAWTEFRAHESDPYSFTVHMRSRIIGSVEMAASYDYRQSRYRQVAREGAVRIRGLF